MVAFPYQTDDVASLAGPLASNLFSWGKVGFVSATRNDSFVTAPPQLSAQLAFGFIPCRSSGMNKSNAAKSGQKKKKKKLLANCVLIKQLIKFHLVHFPCNKALIMSGWEGFFWAGWGCECRATHTLLPWREEHNNSRAKGWAGGGSGGFWWSKPFIEPLWFQPLQLQLTGTNFHSDGWWLKMGWKLFRALCFIMTRKINSGKVFPPLSKKL